MDSDGQTLTFAILIACLIGISLCVVLIIYVTGTDYFYHGYSELYLKDHTRLPDTIEPADPLNFSFVVVSHHKDRMTYEYVVFFDNETIQSGSFLIPDSSPNVSHTIPVSFIPFSPGYSDTGLSQKGVTGAEQNAGSIGSAHIISVEVHETSPGDITPQSYTVFFPVHEHPE